MSARDPRPLSEEAQCAFFTASLEQTREAERVLGRVEQDLLVAGAVVRLIFAGEHLCHLLLPALAHLAIPPSDAPEVTLHIWDSATSGIDMPPAPSPTRSFTHRGDIWTMRSDRIRSAYHALEYSMSLYDRRERVGICWFRAADALPYWTLAAPFRSIFNWWLDQHGLHLLHAAAVGTDAGGILITGPSGVGKSTTALSCLATGFAYAGDDYVIVRAAPLPLAFSLYRTAKIKEGAIGRFARFRPVLGHHRIENKAVVLLEQGLCGPQGIPLTLIATPEFADRDETSLAPVAEARLRDAAVYTTRSQLPHAGDGLEHFADALLARLPGRLLRLGRDWDAVPDAIRVGIEAIERQPRAAARAMTAASPLISVIIPVHNGAHFVADAVASIQLQDYPAIDLIVVDDGSTDAIEDAVERLPIKARFFRQFNLGPAAARNRGIQEAAGSLIAFLDVDDLWPADTLRSQLALLDDRRATVAIGRGQRMERDAEGHWQPSSDRGRDFPFSIPAALFRADAFATVGLFDERLRFGEDTDWFVRAGEADLHIARTERTTLLVRRHGGNMTADKSLSALTPARLFKNILDRRRARESAG